MEERTAVFCLLLRSACIDSISIHLCDPEDSVIHDIDLSNYQESIFRTPAIHSHYYMLISEPNDAQHFIEVPLPYNDGPSLDKEVHFGSFDLKIRTSLEKQRDLGIGQIESFDFSSIAKEHYLGLKTKVLEKLQKEKYIVKPTLEVKTVKSRVFKRKPKKNLTDFFTKASGVKKVSIIHASTNTFSKFRVMESSQDQSLPSIPKLVKMSTSLEEFSFIKRINQDSDNQSIPSSNFKDKPKLKKENRFQAKKTTIKLEQSCKKISKISQSRFKFAEVLQRHTLEQLQCQKATLNYMKTIVLTEVPALVSQSPSKKSRTVNKKNSFSCYRAKKLRKTFR